MKTCLCLLAVGMAACETAGPPTYTASRGAASAAYRATPAAVQPSASLTPAPSGSAMPPPDAQLLHQQTSSDAFGTTTYTSSTQVRGPVMEEVHIGNQRVYSNQPLYPPATIDGVVQPGYVPAGTTHVIDPVTGRSIPVRRR